MIGFPGLGLEFEINPVMFEWGWFRPHWYGLIIAVGFLAAVLYCLRICKRFGILEDEVIDMLFLAVPAGIVGARLVYVVFNWGQFSGDLPSILFTWTGGLSIYGAILFSALAAFLFCRGRKVNAGAMLDMGAFGFLIGQAVGRWGNFVNAEIYGRETELPWRMAVHGSEVHPLFLYESLWCIAGFVLLRLLLNKRKYNGQIFTMYIAWYGLGRAFFEAMRDPRYNLMAGPVPVMLVVAVATCLVALTLLYVRMTSLKKEEDLLAWTAERDANLKQRKARKPAASPEPLVIIANELDETGAAADGAADEAESESFDATEDSALPEDN